MGHAESNAGRCQAQKLSEVLLFGLQRYCRFRRKTAKISTMYGIKIVSLTPKKILKKVFQWILLGLSVLINILKVYQNWSIRKVFFSKWRPRWPTKPMKGHKSETINSILMIFGSIPRFLGVRNTLRPSEITLDIYFLW